jgi:hypothetical protein
VCSSTGQQAPGGGAPVLQYQPGQRLIVTGECVPRYGVHWLRFTTYSSHPDPLWLRNLAAKADRHGIRTKTLN